MKHKQTQAKQYSNYIFQAKRKHFKTIARFQSVCKSLIVKIQDSKFQVRELTLDWYTIGDSNPGHSD